MAHFLLQTLVVKTNGTNVNSWSRPECVATNFTKKNVAIPVHYINSSIRITDVSLRNCSKLVLVAQGPWAVIGEKRGLVRMSELAGPNSLCSHEHFV